MPALARKHRTSRTERLNVFCTPAEKQAVRVAAAEAGVPINRFVLDALGITPSDASRRAGDRPAIDHAAEAQAAGAQ